MKFLTAFLIAITLTTPAFAEEVSVAGGLSGTFLDATNQPSTAQALILVGSGPTDRNGNSPLGVTAGMYKQLAEALSAKGVGTTRVDKRGMFGSAAGAADANSVYIPQLASDAHLWAKRIKAKTGADCVWLIGHSEGGLVALVAAQDPNDICGLVLISTPGRPAGDVLRDQLRANPANAPILSQAEGAVTALENGKDVDVGKLHPALQGLFAPAIQGFWKSLLAVDPEELAKAYTGPVLVVQGTTDIQVSVEDAKRLTKAHQGAELVLLKGVNHVLKQAPADRAGNIATYSNPNLPIDPAIAPAISQFVHRQKPAE